MSRIWVIKNCSDRDAGDFEMQVAQVHVLCTYTEPNITIVLPEAVRTRLHTFAVFDASTVRLVIIGYKPAGKFFFFCALQ